MKRYLSLLLAILMLMFHCCHRWHWQMKMFRHLCITLRTHAFVTDWERQLPDKLD